MPKGNVRGLPRREGRWKQAARRIRGVRVCKTERVTDERGIMACSGAGNVGTVCE